MSKLYWKDLNLEIREIGGGYIHLIDKADGKGIRNLIMDEMGYSVQVKYGKNGKQITFSLLDVEKKTAK